MKKKTPIILVSFLIMGLSSCSFVTRLGSSSSSSSKSSSLPFSSSSTSSPADSTSSSESSSSLPSSIDDSIYTVSFDANGGLFLDNSSIQKQYIEAGSQVSPIDDPIKDGFAFGGWSLAATGDAKVTFPALVSQSITYFAIWSSGIGEPIDPTTIYFVDQPWWNINAAAVRILYWSSSKPAEVNGTAMMAYVGAKVDAGNNFYNYWSFSFDKGTYDSLLFSRYNGAGDENWGAQTADLSFSDAGFNDLYVLDGTPAWMSEEKKAAGTWSVYDASALSQTVEVTFDFNYEETAGTEKTTVVTIGKGNGVAALVASRSGYVFTGWFDAKTEGAVFDFASAITADLTLFAHWSVETAKHDNGGSLVSYYIVGDGSFGENAWASSRGLQMYSNADAGSTDKAIYLNVSFASGDVWDITDGGDNWYHYDALDPAISASVAACFDSDGIANNNIKVVTAGTYDVYLNASGKIYIGSSVV